MRKILIVFISLLLCFSIKGKAQSCSQNLEDAKPAYYNGQWREVVSKLDGCLTSLSKPEQIEAYKLLVDTQLVFGESDEADKFMKQFLQINPYYEVRESDLAELKELYNSFQIKTRYGLGVSVGVLQPDYVIMRYQSK